MNRHGTIEQLPSQALGEDRRRAALLFKRLATLRTDARVFDGVEDLRWRGPTDGFAGWPSRLGDDRLLPRCHAAVQEAAHPPLKSGHRPHRPAGNRILPDR